MPYSEREKQRCIRLLDEAVVRSGLRVGFVVLKGDR